jgi:hypothetical protein
MSAVKLLKRSSLEIAVVAAEVTRLKLFLIYSDCQKYPPDPVVAGKVELRCKRGLKRRKRRAPTAGARPSGRFSPQSSEAFSPFPRASAPEIYFRNQPNKMSLLTSAATNKNFTAHSSLVPPSMPDHPDQDDRGSGCNRNAGWDAACPQIASCKFPRRSAPVSSWA